MISKPFGPRIGIVGGGQLGKMLIEAGLPWNVNYNVLDPGVDAPAARYAAEFIHGSLTDREAILKLAEVSDILTYEIEHIDVETLIELEGQGKTVIPGPRILKTIQDKSLQKQFYSQNELSTTPFTLFHTIDEMRGAASDFSDEKIVVKSAKGGYDGKGVWILNRSDVQQGNVPFELNGNTFFLEQFLGHARELSVIVARNTDGDSKTYPSVEMVFDPELNLVDYLFAPANVTDEEETALRTLAHDAIDALEGVGLFAVEMFLTDEGEVFINEIAPRPHNSGHQTIEGNVTSQYEQLNRILLGLPLGETDLYSPVVMINLLGDQGVSGDYGLSGLDQFFAAKDAHLHWYNKSQTRPGRKMGHITVRASSVHEAHTTATHIRSRLKMQQR